MPIRSGGVLWSDRIRGAADSGHYVVARGSMNGCRLARSWARWVVYRCP